MMDFLKAYPAFSMQDYIWGLSAPMIKIMISDATQVMYLSEKQQQEYKQWKRTGFNRGDATDNPDEFAAALGIPTFN